MKSFTNHAIDRKTFGNAIQRERKSHGMSQEQLALAAHLDRSYMGRIERGEQSISFDKIIDICTALAVSPAQLFANLDSPQS